MQKTKITNLLFATGNQNKVKEIRTLIKDLPYSIQTMGEIGFEEDIPETGKTLLENAIIKAEYLYEKTNSNVIAEDTGLEVDALGGKPGVYSARFAGEDNNAEKNMDLLLEKLGASANRKAKFHTVIALILDGELFTFQGKVNGTIQNKKTGFQGFGYDPLFVPKNETRSFAEMSIEEKSKISHRARAFKKMVDFLTKLNEGTDD